MASLPRILLGAGLVLRLAGCAGAGEDTDPPRPFTLVLLAGDGQELVAGDTSAPLRVRVLEPDGQPASEEVVTWGIDTGYGLLTATQSLTNATGVASSRFIATDTGSHAVYAVLESMGDQFVMFHVHVSPALPSDSCLAGTLTVGASIDDSLSHASCVQREHYWSGWDVPYAKYTIGLEEGHGYLIAVESPNDGGFDPTLALQAIDSSGELPIPLSFDDDEGQGLNSEIFFVAPTSGTFELVVASFGGAFGASTQLPFRLSATECPVVGIMDHSGTATFPLTPTPCFRHGPGSIGTRVVLVDIPAAASDSLRIRVTSPSFTPQWEAFGPDWDTYCNVYCWITHPEDPVHSTYVNGLYNGVLRTLVLHDIGGHVTLALGARGTAETGTFQVALERIPAAAVSSRLASKAAAAQDRVRRRGAPQQKRAVRGSWQ